MTLYDHIAEQYGSIMAFCRKYSPKDPHRLKRSLYNWNNNPLSISIGTAKTLAKQLKVDVCEIVKLKPQKGEE